MMNRQLTVVRQSQGDKFVPSVRVKGEYLKGLNFNIGDKINMICENNVIMLVKNITALEHLKAKNPNVDRLIKAFNLSLD